MYIDVILPCWGMRCLAVMSHACQLITNLQLFTSEDCAEEMLLVYESAHVAIEMRPITTPNQTILNVCTKYIFQIVF